MEIYFFKPSFLCRSLPEDLTLAISKAKVYRMILNHTCGTHYIIPLSVD